tara:strand:- start:2898 stop:3494 length:597 start_codon:yes stop_codon:yes gene_type:complete
MITHIKRRFNRNFLALVDYQSVASEALLKAVSKYNEENGHFANYFMTWLRSMVTREGINNPTGIRLPEHLAKKDFQFTDDARSLIIAGKAKEELMQIYRLTSSQYDSLMHYYTEVPKYLECETTHSQPEDSDLALDIETMLELLPSDYRRAVSMYYGLDGFNVYQEDVVVGITGRTVADVEEYLRNSEEVKNIMGEYI